MSINIDNFNKLNELVSLKSLRKPKIVLNPDEEYQSKPKKRYNNEELYANVICDKNKWEIPEELNTFVNELSNNDKLTNEEKILMIFEELCKDYTYDDNVLSYMKKLDDDKFALPDWYGRDTDKEWRDERAKHNRRVCYEISRILAKSLSELFRKDNDYNICILWDIDLTHYSVGLTCDDYTLTLDLDNFNNIKDLTRLKTGLTIEGIEILEDDKEIFKNALNDFNKDKGKYAIKKISSEINKSSEMNDDIKNDEDLIFLKNAVQVLTDEFDIDSQGLFEYMKEIVDVRLGPEVRKKVWKKIPGKSDIETKYMRCLMFDINNQKYLIDAEEKSLREFDEEEFKKEDAVYIPYKELSRDWDEYYNGR